MRSIGRAHEMITCLCIAARTSQVPYARCAGEGAPLRVGGSRYLNFVRAACLRVRWDPLVMRGVSLVGVSQSEVGITVTVTVRARVRVRETFFRFFIKRKALQLQ